MVVGGRVDRALIGRGLAYEDFVCAACRRAEEALLA